MSSSSNTFALVSNVTTGTRFYEDNILWNARSNASGTGTNYAISLAALSGATSNYNDLFANGVGGCVASGAPGCALADWQTFSGQDANSISVDSQYINPNGNALTGDLHIFPTSPCVGAGLTIAGITNDFDNGPRANPPAIGADEPPFTPSPTPTARQRSPPRLQQQRPLLLRLPRRRRSHRRQHLRRAQRQLQRPPSRLRLGYGDSDSYVYADAYCDGDLHADANTRGEPNPNSDGHVHSNGDRNGYVHSNCDSYGDGDSYSDRNSYGYGNTDSHSHGYGNAASHAYANSSAACCPKALKDSNETASSFTANWTSVSGATSYRLDVSTSNTFVTYVPGYQDRNVGNVTSRM